MKMYPDDWRVRVTTAVTIAVCMAAAIVIAPATGINRFGGAVGLTIIFSIVIGIVLGQLVGRLLFRPSSVRPPE